MVRLASAAGQIIELPASGLLLAPAAVGLNPVTGRGWKERVLRLIDRHSPFKLAYVEALLRAADPGASREPLADPLPQQNTRDDGLERLDPTLAAAITRGAAHNPPAPDPAEGGSQYGVRGGAGRSSDVGAGARAASGSTRYVETTRGVLSYTELAPHIAVNVQALESAIAEGGFRQRALDDALILEFHQTICGELLPKIAGRWRAVDVQVGGHVAPSFVEVPVLMRNYCLDLQARLRAFGASLEDTLLESLAFAEGRLLSIHPFEDFNGRVTRAFLAEVLLRLELPVVDPTPRAGQETDEYLRALRAADHQDYEPLTAIWRQRFEQEDAS